MRQRGWVNTAMAMVIVAGITGAAVSARAGREEEPTVIGPPSRTIDPGVPEAKLLRSALYIDDWREFGNPVGFTYVPKSRPPGLVAMMPGNPPNLNGGSHRGSGNGAQLDSYRDGGLFVAVEFSTEPTETCANTEDPPRATCVRDNKPTVPEPDDITLRRTTVYFTANNPATFKSKETEAARRFWANTDFVPVAQAAWFTDLVSRAEAAVQE